MAKLTLIEAKEILSAAESYAQEKLGKSYCIAVLDEGGVLKALHRGDGKGFTHPASVEIASSKALTAWKFRMPVSDLVEVTKPGQSGYDLRRVEGTLFIAGGLPIKRDDETIGAIGACGGSSKEDEEVCEAGLKAIE